MATYISGDPKKLSKNLVMYNLVFSTVNALEFVTPAILESAMIERGFSVTREECVAKIRDWYNRGFLKFEDGRFMVY